VPTTPATHRRSVPDNRAEPLRDVSASSGKLPGIDDEIRRRLLRAVIGEDQPGRGRVRRWTLLEAAERAGLVLNHARRGLQELREQDPPLVWGDADSGTGEELWWLLPSGLNELDRLEAGERR
jgi:hypothetical protein